MYKWEQEQTDPGSANLLRLAELFDVTTDYLLRGEEAAAGHLQRDPRGILLLSRAPSDEVGVRQVVPFRLDHEGSLWGHRIDAFWVADARAEGDVDGLHAGDALLLARTSLEAVREDQTGPLYAVVQQGRRPTLLRVLRPMPPPDEDGEITLVVCGRQPETVAPGDALYRVLPLMPLPDKGGVTMLVVPSGALYRVVAVVRSAGLLDGGTGGTGDPNAAEHRSEQEAVQRLAAVAGVPAPVLEAAVGAAHEAVEEGPAPEAEPDVAMLVSRALRALRSGGETKTVAEMLHIAGALLESPSRAYPGISSGTADELAEISAEAVALIDGGSTHPRLLRAVRAMARRMGSLVRQSEEQPTDLVSMAEAARLIGVSRQAVHLAVTSGRLPTYGEGKVGRVSLREARMLVGGEVPGIILGRRQQPLAPHDADGADGADGEDSAAPGDGTPGGNAGPTGEPDAEEGAIVQFPDEDEHAAQSSDPAKGTPRRRVLLADLVMNPPAPLEKHIAARMHEWVRWADARYDAETMLRYEQDPPDDLPPPWDYHHYDYWETRRSAAHGLQWWEYPEEHKLAEYARFIRRMEEMYKEGDRKRKSDLWATAREEYGPDAPLPDEDPRL